MPPLESQMRRARFAWVILSLATVGTGATVEPHDVLAQSDTKQHKAEARRHFEAGIALMEAEDWMGAVREFQASVKLHANRANLFNLANAYKAVHRYDEALATLSRLDREYGGQLTSQMTRDVREMRQNIEAIVARVTVEVEPSGAHVFVDDRALPVHQLGRPILLGPGVHEIRVSADRYSTVKRKVDLVSGQSSTETFSLKLALGRIAVETTPTESSVKVNGEDRGTTPIHPGIELPAGEHIVVITKEGYEPTSRIVTLSEGGNVSVHVTLAPIAAPVSATGAPVVPPDKPPQVNDGASRKGSSVWPWVSLGGTVLFGAGAIASWAVADKHAGDFETYDGWYADPSITDAGELATYDEQRTAEADDTTKFSRMAIGLGATAGVLAVTTIVLFATGGQDDTAVTAQGPGRYNLQVRF